MAESAQIQKVSPRHEAILNYLIANPTVKKAEVAAQFGVSQAWLSTIIHSDAFQAKLRARQEEVFEVAVLSGIEDKLLGVAHQAAERLGELLPLQDNVRDISDTMDKALKSLGYGRAPVIQQNINNNYGEQQINNLTAADIERARELVGKARQVEVPQLEQMDRDDLPALPSTGDSRVGTQHQEAPLQPASESQERKVS